MTKPESQNTGTETIAPTIDMASVGKRGPMTFTTDSAMTSAAPVFSSTRPIIVPRVMTRPIEPRILPKPVPITAAMPVLPVNGS